MKTKLLTSAGCLLLLAALISPSVVGHDDGGDDPYSNVYVDGNGDRSGVSGRYVGATGPAIAEEGYANPQDTLAIGAMLCDGEVVIDDATFPGNEETVDGDDSGDGVLPDTIDDGGQGGACHSVSYTTQSFNTDGCLGGNIARGQTAVPTDIWLGASCDWKTDEGGANSVVTFLLCVVNEVLQIPNTDLVSCIDQLLLCLSVQGCATGATQSCGVDHTADAVNFGSGLGTKGADAIFPANGGIFNGPPPGQETCDPGDEAASIFVFDTVLTTSEPESDTGVHVYPALTGQVWTNTGTLGLPACVHATAANFGTVLTQSVCDDGNGVICAPFVSTWNPLPTPHEVVTCTPWYTRAP